MSGYTIRGKGGNSTSTFASRQLKEHGLTSKDLTFEKKQLKNCGRIYRESGVRGLEAKIAQVIRNAAKSVAMEEEYNKKVTDEDIIRVLGVPRLERTNMKAMTLSS
jgi:ATP-dependent Lon protease